MEDFIQLSEENPVDPIDLSIFKEHIKKSLLNILDTLPKEDKILVLEESCIPKINFFTDLAPLQERGIKDRLLKLKPNTMIPDKKIIVYIIPAKQEFLDYIENHIKFNLHNYKNNQTEITDNKEYHVIFVPKISNECQSFINLSDYKSYYFIHNLNIDLYTFDNDLLSLEEHSTLQDLYINNNYNVLSVLSRCILKFETVFGKIKNKYVKGDFSKILKEILTKEEEQNSFENDTEILATIIMDRSCDFITPFCSNYIYEGLLDEYLEINYNTIKCDPKILEKDSKTEAKIDCSRRDKFFTLVKDYNFKKLRNFLPNRLAIHSKIVEEGKRENDLKRIKENLKNVKLMKDERPSLINQINLASYILQKQEHPKNIEMTRLEQYLLADEEYPSNLHDFYDREIGKKTDYKLILKLLCLESLTQGGIKKNYYDELKRDFLTVYGYQKIFLLRNLEKMKILKKSDYDKNYSQINKKLNLIVAGVDIDQPNDCAFAYEGYCPISIRLIERAIKTGWNSIKDVLNKLPGEFEYPNNESEVIKPNEKSFILLVFVGGITYGEIAAIRYLNSKNKFHKFVILTTSIINYNNVLNGLNNMNIENNERDIFTFKDYNDQIENYTKK